MQQSKIIFYYQRYYNYFKRCFWETYNTIFKFLFNNSKKLKAEYVDWLMQKNYEKKSKDYTQLSENTIQLKENMPKLISFYLPQFHETEINNNHFGKGFMEWYNTNNVIPMYTGHNQPQLPIDVGYYDLTHDDIMYRQIELAKKYGIFGFCFYYYWFYDETLLEKPLLNFLNNKNLDMPFCLCWVDGNWERTWGSSDKKETEIIKQMMLPDDADEKYFNDLLKYFKDDRYIKINNMPILIIFKLSGWKNENIETKRIEKLVSSIQQKAKQEGFAGIKILTTTANLDYTLANTDKIIFDGVVEFDQPTSLMATKISNVKNKYINKNFRGKIIDVKSGLDENLHLKQKYNFKTFKSVPPGWDNSARKAYTNCFVFDMTPNDYKRWLKDVIQWTKKNHSKEEQIVFINAWNEWAEGAHLEPDQYYGYAYLQATKEALEETANT